MVTAIDTNVLVALWDPDDSLNQAAQRSLDEALSRGTLVISAAGLRQNYWHFPLAARLSLTLS